MTQSAGSQERGLWEQRLRALDADDQRATAGSYAAQALGLLRAWLEMAALLDQAATLVPGDVLVQARLAAALQTCEQSWELVYFPHRECNFVAGIEHFMNSTEYLLRSIAERRDAASTARSLEAGREGMDDRHLQVEYLMLLLGWVEQVRQALRTGETPEEARVTILLKLTGDDYVLHGLAKDTREGGLHPELLPFLRRRLGIAADAAAARQPEAVGSQSQSQSQSQASGLGRLRALGRSCLARLRRALSGWFGPRP